MEVKVGAESKRTYSHVINNLFLYIDYDKLYIIMKAMSLL